MGLWYLLKNIIIKIGLAVWSGRIAQEFIHNMKIIFLNMAALFTCLWTNWSIAYNVFEFQKNNQPYELSRSFIKRSRVKTQNIWMSERSERRHSFNFVSDFFLTAELFCTFLLFFFVFFVCLYVRKSLCDGSRPNGWTDCDEYIFL